MKVFTKKCLVVMMALLMTSNMTSQAQAASNNKRGGNKEYQIIAQAPYGGSQVLSHFQGLRYDGLAVLTARSNPSTTLTYELGMNESNFYSLGFGTKCKGWIIIEFKNPIQNGPGNDIQVIEDTWGLPYPKETAGIYVSKDGKKWKYLGDANNQKPISNYHTASEFDLDQVCLEEAKFVKVQDKSIPADFASYSPVNNSTLDGFDLNVVLALHDYVIEVDRDCYQNNGKKNNWFTNLCNWTWKFSCQSFSNGWW